jgi:hypothetical protein
MKFKPVTENYEFDAEELRDDYPDYLQIPIATWIKNVLYANSLWYITGNIYKSEKISDEFINELNITFREVFPREPMIFLQFVLEISSRTTNILGLCLQNYANTEQSQSLEEILSTGGSAYSVMITSKSPLGKGVADIIMRVPTVVAESSNEALESDSLIREAWHACYSRNPDYSKTVSKCVDVLEGLLRDKYFSKTEKPNLTSFVKDLALNPTKLSYKGDDLISPPNLLIDLSKNFIPIRGQHTNGTGKNAAREEAEFVLHYTIFVWNLHR